MCSVQLCTVPAMPPARLNATAFWLTYSQSSLSKEEVLAVLQSLGTLKRACVCQEHHRDDALHYHALVEYARKKDVTTSHFDIKGEHPNILVWCRTDQYEQWLVDHWNYCYKEDLSPLVVGDKPELNRKRSRNEVVLECVEVAKTGGLIAAQQHALKVMASDYCKSVNSYDKVFMREANVTPPVPARPVSDFPNAPAIPDDWQNLFFWGETGTGKTQFARALLPNAMVIRHSSQLVDCRFTDGVIFDDFGVSHWPATAVIHLLDWDEPSGINVKYGCVNIPPHTRKIFTFNDDFDVWARLPPSQYDRGDRMTDRQRDAVCSRFQLIRHIAEPLYSGPNRRLVPTTVPQNCTAPFPVASYINEYAMFQPPGNMRCVTEERFVPEREWSQDV